MFPSTPSFSESTVIVKDLSLFEEKIMISSCQSETESFAGTGKDKTYAFFTSKGLYNPQKNSSHWPAANHLPPTAGMHLGNSVQAAVLHSIHFFRDQCLHKKGHSCPTEAQYPMGKCLARSTHSLHFYSHIESLRERRIRSKGVRLERIPYSAVGWQLAASVMVTLAGSFTHDLFFPPAGASLSRPLICFSHDLDLWFFFSLLSVFLMNTKRLSPRCLPRMALRYLKRNRKCQTFASSFGYPPAFWE